MLQLQPDVRNGVTNYTVPSRFFSLAELPTGSSYRHTSRRDQQQDGGDCAIAWTSQGREGPRRQQQALPPLHGGTWATAPGRSQVRSSRERPQWGLASCLGAASEPQPGPVLASGLPDCPACPRTCHAVTLPGHGQPVAPWAPHIVKANVRCARRGAELHPTGKDFKEKAALLLSGACRSQLMGVW